MDRRKFIKNSAFTSAGIAISASNIFASTKPPNILLIEVDQMRFPRYDCERVTPNIDRIAKSGVSFTKHFVSAVPCSPSRACLFTGTYTTQNNMNTNCDFQVGERQPSLDPKIPTMGHVFQKGGYRTPYRGKWHLTRKGDFNKHDPLIDYGFEGWKRPDAPFGGPPYNGFAVDQFYARQAGSWLLDKKNHEKPWLLVCNMVNPHDICEFPRYYPHERLKGIRAPKPPDNYKDDLKGKPGCQTEFRNRYQKLAGFIDPNDANMWRRYLDFYAACLRDVDENVGDVLDALEKSGQKDNTIIIFTSDHGEMAGSHGLRTKGNFAYEEVMNVPLIFSWPGKIQPGTVTEAFASNVDVMPTLASLAGLSNLPYMAGKDLSKVLFDPSGESVQDEIIYHSGWELEVSLTKKNRTAAFTKPAQVRAIREKEWKYAYYFQRNGGGEIEHELYNLKDDPLEMTNLANDAGYIARRNEMRGRLMEREKKLVEEFQA